MTIVAWAVSGALAMYFEAIAIAAELRDFPGGPKALAVSIYPTIEAMRIIRWPADRLDTLGGYLAYHNIVLFNFFLAIFAAIQGARLIRHLEESRDVEFYLATGVSRGAMIWIRTLGYLISQIVISISLGIGTALALAASGQANTAGALRTLLAGGICIFPVFGLGLLISQFASSARTAAGITSIVITVIYVIDNISGKYRWLEWFKFLSPFHYANQSRPVIPGFTPDYGSWILMLVVGAIFVAVAARLLESRDIGSTSLSSTSQESNRRRGIGFVPKGIITDTLWRQRFGIVAWVITTSTFLGVFIAMMQSVIDIWKQFAFLKQFQLFGFGETPEQQYLALVYEVIPPFLAAFVITQSAKWTSDLVGGRVQLFLSAPISWAGLIIRRVCATLIVSAMIILGATTTTLVGGYLQGSNLYLSGVFRVMAMSMLFALAFASINALLVAILHGKSATQFLSIYVGAAWLIGFMVPYLKWPTWVIRLSIFDSFGHPFAQWPSLLNFVTILIMAIPGLIAAIYIADRSAKI